MGVSESLLDGYILSEQVGTKLPVLEKIVVTVYVLKLLSLIMDVNKFIQFVTCYTKLLSGRNSWQ